MPFNLQLLKQTLYALLKIRSCIIEDIVFLIIFSAASQHSAKFNIFPKPLRVIMTERIYHTNYSEGDKIHPRIKGKFTVLSTANGVNHAKNTTDK